MVSWNAAAGQAEFFSLVPAIQNDIIKFLDKISGILRIPVAVLTEQIIVVTESR